MTTLRIKNWGRWQSYRADRGQPPWIKVHRCVMRNPEWVALTDAQRGQLVAIWLLAADHDGVIPASPAVIKKLCYLDTEPDLKLLMDHGFIEDDANVTPERRQHDAPEKSRVEKRREEEKEGSSAREIAPPPLALVSDRLTFSGKVILADRSLFDQWRARFRYIPDLTAALEKADAYYGDNPPRGGKWLFPVSRWLEKENGEWKERGDEKRKANDIRSF